MRCLSSNRFRVQTTFFQIVLTVLLLSGLSAAQAAPKYDPATETKLKGTVEELKLPAKENTKEVAHLMIKNGDVVLDI